MKKQLVIRGKLFFSFGEGRYMFHWVKQQLKTISLFFQLSIEE